MGWRRVVWDATSLLEINLLSMDYILSNGDSNRVLNHLNSSVSLLITICCQISSFIF
jgi:hypothetical protein